MNVNGIGALSAYTYQNTLAQTGSSNQALGQALAASQAQVNDLSAMFSNSGSTDPLTAIMGLSTAGALDALTYSASGNAPASQQALLDSNSPASSLTSLFSSSDGLSLSAAMLAPNATEALARYTYDQSQNQGSSAQQTASQAIASAQQSMMAASLNLLA